MDDRGPCNEFCPLKRGQFWGSMLVLGRSWVPRNVAKCQFLLYASVGYQSG